MEQSKYVSYLKTLAMHSVRADRLSAGTKPGYKPTVSASKPTTRLSTPKNTSSGDKPAPVVSSKSRLHSASVESKPALTSSRSTAQCSARSHQKTQSLSEAQSPTTSAVFSPDKIRQLEAANQLLAAQLLSEKNKNAELMQTVATCEARLQTVVSALTNSLAADPASAKNVKFDLQSSGQTRPSTNSGNSSLRLSDLAPTPAQAAESMVPSSESLLHLLEDLQKQAIECISRKESIATRLKPLLSEVSNLINFVSRFKRLIKACSDGSLAKVLKSADSVQETSVRTVEEGRKLIVRAQGDLREVEDHLVAWYGDLCAGRCVVYC